MPKKVRQRARSDPSRGEDSRLPKSGAKRVAEIVQNSTRAEVSVVDGKRSIKERKEEFHKEVGWGLNEPDEDQTTTRKVGALASDENDLSRTVGALASDGMVTQASQNTVAQATQFVQYCSSDERDESFEALVDAEDKGHLLLRLREKLMPVHLFARASYHLHEVLTYIDEQWQQRGDQAAGLEEPGPSEDVEAPAPQAYLLANFMMAPSPVAEQILEGIVEQMVLYKSDQPPAPVFPRFPKALAPFFIIEKPELLRCCRFHKETGQVKFLSLSDQWKDTSQEYAVTFTNRESALINKQACYFVYIYAKIGADTCGGFLYLSDERKPVAVTAITTDSHRHAMPFRSRASLSLQDAQALKDRLKVVGLGPAKKAGATHYAFVGPGEELNGEKVEYGAFVYTFAEETDENCFFLMDPPEKIVLTANISTRLHAARVHCAADPQQIRESVTQQKTTWMDWLVSRGSKWECDAPVKVARLKVPTVLHPIVLWSLTNSTRREVAATLAAKAISTAAFDKYKYFIVVDVLAVAMQLLALFFAATSMKAGKSMTLCAIVMFGLLVWNLTVEVLIWQGWKRWGFGKYITEGSVIGLFRLLVEAVTVVLMMISQAFSLPSDHVSLRFLFSLAALVHWSSAINRMSNFNHLGQLILPILHAVNKVWSFILVITCCMFACVQAGYALSDDSVWATWRRTFILAFLGEPDFEEQEHGTETFLPGVGVSEEFKYAFFIFASLMLAVAVGNIFIGVMLNAFDYYLDRANELFVKHRASTTLDWALFCQGARQVFGSGILKPEDKGELVWFCNVLEASWKDEADDSMSLRTRLDEEITRIRGTFKGFDDKQDKVAFALSELGRKVEDRQNQIEGRQQDIEGRQRVIEGHFNRVDSGQRQLEGKVDGVADGVRRLEGWASDATASPGPSPGPGGRGQGEGAGLRARTVPLAGQSDSAEAAAGPAPIDGSVHRGAAIEGQLGAMQEQFGNMQRQLVDMVKVVERLDKTDSLVAVMADLASREQRGRARKGAPMQKRRSRSTEPQPSGNC